MTVVDFPCIIKRPDHKNMKGIEDYETSADSNVKNIFRVYNMLSTADKI